MPSRDPLTPSTRFPDDNAIRRILADRIDTRREGVGIVVGMVGDGERRVVGYGRFGQNDARIPDQHTAFEIGSVTKVYTAILLADMIASGEVSLDEPVQRLLPGHPIVPERNGRTITLHDLATHTSALPRHPDNMVGNGSPDPFSGYTIDLLYAFLARYELTRDIGSEFEYSNLGVGLLGYALACRAGTDYETVLRARILTPLQLASTAIALPDEIERRCIPGHDLDLRFAQRMDLGQVFGAAGALVSTVGDQLQFLEAVMGHRPSALDKAIGNTLDIRRQLGDQVIPLCWGTGVCSIDGEPEWFGHTGGTLGCRSFIGFDRRASRGVVVLANAAFDVGDIGLHLLKPEKPLRQPVKIRNEIDVDPARLQSYAGRFWLRPDFILTMTVDNGQLFTQGTGQPRIALYPEAEHRFFAKMIDAQITFEMDDQGMAEKLTLHQNGSDLVARKLDS
ncbi:serine hydrolase [Paraburkholderia sp. BL25I1N1]|uniref:serine hydrolase n=1 Tax=Paraburkholderia sp. BL25I1N1 TaxID=1938804 RepID=UPI000D05F3DB|nr:serine hydrolase [Paraburkholderia sp. BL25I1N1]PRX88931.1 CubicO group peptidase (beta-lactamase class C family) [Paraburkholderia sp. BL25I1N1]